MSFQILGTGRAQPEYILTNDELSTMVDTSDEWIVPRTGIKTRRICTHETLTDLAAAAARQAIASAGLAPSDIGLIICSTLQGDYKTPMLSGMLLRELHISCPVFDLNAACSGFIYALDTAAAYLDSGRADNILVVGAEMMTKHIDWSDRATCVLFGDGAGAVVLKKGTNLLSMRVRAKADEQMLLAIGGTHGESPFYKAPKLDEYLHMAGGEVFKFAVGSMCRDVKAVMKEAGVTPADVRYILPHQANVRVITAAAERLGFREEQVGVNIDHCGNTSSASIPLLLDEMVEAGRIARGDILVMTAFGGGLTSGACVVKY